jgi:hypothetical protein
MSADHELHYAPGNIRSGHSLFSVASLATAIAVFLFIAICDVSLLDRSPFESMGNGKETVVSSLAAILGILLAMRALTDPTRKPILAIVGLSLNIVAFLAAWILLPFL